MDEFYIPSAAGSGGLLFYNRVPYDSSLTIEKFCVEVTDHNLSAACEVYAGYGPSHPASVFLDMAQRWSGWAGELKWRSLEGELSIRCSHDRLGHISIGVDLQSGSMPEDWRVIATVMAEAGQLDQIAQNAGLFFGRAA